MPFVWRSSFDVVTLGAATQDLFLRSSALEEMPSADAPDGWRACIPFGTKLNVEEMHTTSGGGATNTAVTFARYGLKTACITRIGKDQIGANILDELKREHIQTQCIQYDPTHKTASSVILLSGSGHRAILTYRGASSHLSTKHIPWPSLRTTWLYLTSVGGDLALLKHVFGFARTHNVHVAWNPGTAELEQGLRKLSPLLKQTETLILNREEAALITELPSRHLSQLFQKLGRYPLNTTIITDGQRGAFAQQRQEKDVWFAPTLPAQRINTTGAGDAFGSGYVAAIIRGKSPKTALQIATLNATGVVSHMGPKTGILRRFPSDAECHAVAISRVTTRTL